jgi:hypothetical protein
LFLSTGIVLATPLSTVPVPYLCRSFTVVSELPVKLFVDVHGIELLILTIRVNPDFHGGLNFAGYRSGFGSALFWDAGSGSAVERLLTVEAQNGILEGFQTQWSPIRITLMRSRIRIRIKVMRIRNPGFVNTIISGPLQSLFFLQCCGPGSGIRCLFGPWIRIRDG